MKPPRPGGSAYLDIETSAWGEITVFGLHRPGIGTRQLVGGEVCATGVLETLDGAERIVTYNGTSFDLPVIRKRLGADLKSLFAHDDLMYRCWKHNLKGGLKRVEHTLGIPRDTEGLSGLDAVRLWDAHLGGDREALELLLRYNREDVENLVLLENRLSALAARAAA